MSELYDDDPRAESARSGPSNRSRALVITGVAIVVLFFALTTFASFFTDRLWYQGVGYGGVFSRLFWTRAGLFAFFGTLMAVVVGVNVVLAFRYRPLFQAASQEQQGLDRYRDVVTPIRTWLLVGSVLLLGLFAGTSGAGQWRTFMLWRNGVPFGQRDAYFGKDIGFFVFDLPWLHYLVDVVMAVTVISLLAAAFVHYLYGGIRLQTARDRLSGAAQVQLSALLGVFVLAKGGDYFLDRYDLAYQGGRLLTGITATDDQAVLPAKNILTVIAVICAILFFLNIWRRTWLLPSVGLALLALSAVLLGLIWPGVVQQFQVKPSEPTKEAPYIAKNIEATRTAYNLRDVETVKYSANTASTTGGAAALAPTLRASLAKTPVIDPKLVRSTFEQNQQARAYYSVAPVLDVDRYSFDGNERPVVLGARELDQSGINPADRNWSNQHTVYTHGSGLIAAYANQVAASGSASADDGIVWAEGNEAGQDALSKATGGFEQRIYFGEQSPDYSVVGKAPGAPDVELDLGGSASGDDTLTTYDGAGGVAIGSTFRKLLYAVKFGEPNFLLSSRVNDNSQVLYNRTPRERVEKVAPWLSIDGDAYPAVVDGRVQWILDGYTTTDRYPGSQRESFQKMTDDSLGDTTTGIRTLPTDEINYMRNAVKATVDAYDGTVKLYAWDESDPILKAWQSAFPGTVEPRSAIPASLLEHLRYPEDLFKVQRFQLARYHVTDPGDWYQGSDRWDVPEDPNAAGQKQPPYRLFVNQDSGAPTGETTGATAGAATDPGVGGTASPTAATAATAATANEAWSLTSVFVPFMKNNLASFVSVNSDATSPDYGKMRVLELADEQTQGPGLVSNDLQSNNAVREELTKFQIGQSKPQFGNLLTLPVEGGLIYVEPVYALRTVSSSSYPILTYVLVSYNGQIGIGSSLATALADALNVDLGVGAAPTGGATTPPDPVGAPSAGPSPTPAPTTGSVEDQIRTALSQADQAFTAADAALAAGDLAGYQAQVDKAQGLIQQAISLDNQRNPSPSGSSTPSPSPSPSTGGN